PPVLGEQPPAQTSEPEAVAPSKSAEARAPSTFQVRNMLGLSGNRGQAAAAVAAPSTPTPAPTPTPVPTDDSRPSLLGLRTTGTRRQSAHSPPPLVADDPSGLPPLTDVGSGREQSASHGMAFNDLKQRLERIKSDGSSTTAKPSRQVKRPP